MPNGIDTLILNDKIKTASNARKFVQSIFQHHYDSFKQESIDALKENIMLVCGYAFVDKNNDKFMNGKKPSPNALPTNSISIQSNDLNIELRHINKIVIANEDDCKRIRIIPFNPNIVNFIALSYKDNIVFDALSELSALLLKQQEELPAPLIDFVHKILSKQHNRPNFKGPNPGKNIWRDSIIRAIFLRLKDRGYHPMTRNHNSKHKISVADIIVEELLKIGIKSPGFSGVVSIWNSQGEKISGLETQYNIPLGLELRDILVRQKVLRLKPPPDPDKPRIVYNKTIFE